ncbi:MAG: metal-dependent transcriptional regulator [Candidatus Gastranaerophilales bacterium]|nr:metal-dependent transcriptional regulator [Candidatus Gastranaerophilales bacterium]
MKELTQSLEKYLHTVYELVQKNSAARVKDVAAKMQVGASSTSEAVKALAKKGYLKYEPYGLITMTSKGQKIVEEKINRHQTIRTFLETVLMMKPEEIETSANNIEFSMTEDVLKRFVEFLTFMQTCTCKEPKWIKSFQYFVNEGKMQEKCNTCIKNKDTFDNSHCCGCGV